jgi:hypothetical protein
MPQKTCPLTRTWSIGSSLLAYQLSAKEEAYSKDIYEARKAQHGGLE